MGRPPSFPRCTSKLLRSIIGIAVSGRTFPESFQILVHCRFQVSACSCRPFSHLTMVVFVIGEIDIDVDAV